MGKSLQEFRAWAEAKKTVPNPQVNTYPGQCVSLIQQYLYQVFGVGYKPRGNAKDFVPPGFKRISVHDKRKPGDIVRYPGSMPGSGGYGHIGIIDDRGYFLDQNGTKRRAVGSRATPFGGIEAVFRPTKAFNVKKPKPAPKPAPKPSTSTYQVKKTIRGYINSADAKNRKNAKVKVRPGKYYVFNRSNGMLNVTSKKGTPGSWINPGDNK